MTHCATCGADTAEPEYVNNYGVRARSAGQECDDTLDNYPTVLYDAVFKQRAFISENRFANTNMSVMCQPILELYRLIKSLWVSFLCFWKVSRVVLLFFVTGLTVISHTHILNNMHFCFS